MRVHEYIETIFFCQSQYLNCVLNPFLIIYPRPGRLDSLPRKDVSDCIVTPTLQPGEVDVRILLRKGPGMEIDIVPVEEVLCDMGWLIWIAGIFGISGYIDSSQGDLSTMDI
jgi:hypothetical protein